jgi:hypothetical protein
MGIQPGSNRERLAVFHDSWPLREGLSPPMTAYLASRDDRSKK